jgi:hypothetical protein
VARIVPAQFVDACGLMGVSVPALSAARKGKVLGPAVQ